MNSNLLQFDREWTLFLDRDGVINKHLPDAYVTKLEEFEFIPGSLEAIASLSNIFGRIIIVTNQQGIGKGLMTEMDLQKIHFFMEETISKNGGKIDAIYYCPFLSAIKPKCRKPEIGMALDAKKDFPAIDFTKSVMVGDSPSDLQFGDNIGAINIFVKGHHKLNPSQKIQVEVNSLFEFSILLKKDTDNR